MRSVKEIERRLHVYVASEDADEDHVDVVTITEECADDSAPVVSVDGVLDGRSVHVGALRNLRDAITLFLKETK